MTDHTHLYRRLLRRETHASRSGAAVTVAVLLAMVLIAAIGFSGWWTFDPMLRENVTTWTASVDIADIALIGGVVALLLALLLIVASIAPGRRARHARATDRFAVVVDDGVLADAAAHSVAYRSGLDRGQVSTTVGRRGVTVRITPTSGVAVDRELVARTAVAAIADAQFDAAATVEIAQRGVIA